MTNPSDSADFRSWVKERARELGVDAEDLLIQSKRRDALYKGTDADRKKAEWFARYWKRAVKDRDVERIHVRGVHYFIYGLDEDVEPPTNCSWPVYRNTETCYNYLESAAKLARILGLVPLDGIEDNKHDQTVVTKYNDHRTRPRSAAGMDVPLGVSVPRTPPPDARAELEFDPDDGAYSSYAAADIAKRAVRELRFDRPSQAPYHVEVWCEKTLPDYIKSVCEDAGVHVVVEGEGDLSLTIAAEFARRVEEAGKPAVVLYLSDFDPKGTEMPANMAAKVAWLKRLGELTERVCIDRLAVTREHIEDLDLPRKPISESNHQGTGGKSYDTKVTEWEERMGVGATELNALENRPEDYKRIVRDALSQYVDPDIPTKNEYAREAWADDAEAAIEAALGDVDDDLSKLRTFLGEYNSALERAEPMLEALHDLREEAYFDEWRQQVRGAIEDARMPTATVPEGEAPLPDDPLYDTNRDYHQNVARIQAYKTSGDVDGADPAE